MTFKKKKIYNHTQQLIIIIIIYFLGCSKRVFYLENLTCMGYPQCAPKNTTLLSALGSSQDLGIQDSHSVQSSTILCISSNMRFDNTPHTETAPFWALFPSHSMQMQWKGYRTRFPKTRPAITFFFVPTRESWDPLDARPFSTDVKGSSRTRLALFSPTF